MPSSHCCRTHPRASVSDALAGRSVESTYTWRHAAETFEAHCEALLTEKAQNPGPRASGLHPGIYT
jgi:hypothetical protein